MSRRGRKVEFQTAQAACVISAGSLKTLCLAALQMFEHVCEILKENGLGRREDIFLFEEEVIDFKKNKNQTKQTKNPPDNLLCT